MLSIHLPLGIKFILEIHIFVIVQNKTVKHLPETCSKMKEIAKKKKKLPKNKIFTKIK